ncbi:actin-related protein 5 [Galendromus occidentalis]|uniref:Actin-related protein 5 n=1 Tax=Galendromus occidentalis TaxID=34638 RepID=A0AAJ7WIM2_9ACAR|nr:actin-related protein 5 [Galendromus occidentalis]
METQVKNAIHEIPDLQRVPDPVSPYDASLKTIVVDNGSYECKVGWNSDPAPRMIFRSHSTKIRGQKGGEICVGNDIANYEASGWMPLKSPFEKNIASHPEIQEHIFDHIFTKLGFHGEASRIDHQIVVTEPICNPNYYRQYMSELLFECYGVPSVVYGIDSMLSLEHNIPHVQNALVIGLGHAVCHVVPVLGNEVQFKRSKRISIGGQNVVATLQRLLQLKHPHLAAAINNSRSEYLTHTFCEFALDYDDAVLKFRDVEHLNKNTTRIQLPLKSIQAAATATTTAGKMDVCYAIIQRVESVMSQKYKMKLNDSQEKLKQLLVIHEMAVCEEDPRKRIFTLNDLGFDSLEEVEATISMLRHRIENTLQSDLPPIVDLCHYSDPESWLLSLRRVREDLKSKISDDSDAQRPYGSREERLSDEETLDRIELIIFETEREFRRPSVLDLDNLRSSSAISKFYQLLLSTEKYRAPEVLFQPTAMLGLEQPGLIETVDRVLQQFEIGEQRDMAQKIFVTGGPACIPGLKERLEREIRAIRPFQSDFEIIMARQPDLDAWNGAKAIASDESVLQFAVSREDYDEFGPDFIKKFKWSNIYAPSPLVVRI